jgi:hypothetical protein
MNEISSPIRELPLLSPRTAKYVAALMREGDNFDYYTWLQGVREEEAHAKRAAAAFTSGEMIPAKIGNGSITPGRQDSWPDSARALMTRAAPVARALWQSNHETRNETPKARLKRRLEKVRDAWDDFQASRARGAVYGYLGSVFEIVTHHKGRRRTKKLLRHAFKFANLPFDRNADPFSAVIRSTCDDEIDNKTISKWSRALRYVALCKAPSTQVKRFMKEAGGVNACADLYARDYGRGRR